MTPRRLVSRRGLLPLWLGWPTLVMAGDSFLCEPHHSWRLIVVWLTPQVRYNSDMAPMFYESPSQGQSLLLLLFSWPEPSPHKQSLLHTAGGPPQLEPHHGLRLIVVSLTNARVSFEHKLHHCKSLFLTARVLLLPYSHGWSLLLTARGSLSQLDTHSSLSPIMAIDRLIVM